MKTDYQAIAIEGAFRLDPGVRTLDELRVKTEAVMLKHGTPTLPTTPVVSLLDESAEDDGVVISRELAKEILGALNFAQHFTTYVTCRVRDGATADYAEGARYRASQAEQRLRRAAIAQEGM